MATVTVLKLLNNLMNHVNQFYEVWHNFDTKSQLSKNTSLFCFHGNGRKVCYHGNGGHFEIGEQFNALCKSIVWSLAQFWYKMSNFQNTPLFVSMATVEKFAQPISIFFHKFVSLDVRSNPIKFWKDQSSRYWEICNLRFYNFYIFFPLPWQRQPFWK